MCQRSALSRIEVAIGLVIGLLLVGLFLAVVGRIRESANLMKCRNNLRQLGLAVGNYSDTNGALPPLTDQGDGAPTGRALASIFANLIPFIESTWFRFGPESSAEYYHAHSSVEFTSPGKGEPITWQGGMVNWPWKVFLDPSDRTAEQLFDVPMTLPDGSTGYYATGSYAANGMLPWGKAGLRKFNEWFPHGIENTILIAERPQVCRTAAGDDVYNLWGLGFYSPHMPAFACLTPTEPAGLWSTRQVAPVEPLPADGDTIPVRIGRRDAEPTMPDFTTPFQRIRAGRSCDPRLPGSPHAAGMQVLMADASVRVFSWDTTPRVFWEACVPDG